MDSEDTRDEIARLEERITEMSEIVGTDADAGILDRNDRHVIVFDAGDGDAAVARRELYRVR